MKANEAPEKLYFGESDKGILDIYSTKESDNEVEYTRTDAFIEKACEFLDGCIPDYIDLIHANVDTFMDVDNKRFIDEFKNYMIKGD